MEKELRHHGIIGQKWGKRNGPPYPLDISDMSYAEKKASKKLHNASKIKEIEEKDKQRTSRMWVRRNQRRNKEALQYEKDANGKATSHISGYDYGPNRTNINRSIVENYVGARNISKEEAQGIARLYSAHGTRALIGAAAGGVWGAVVGGISPALNMDYISKLETGEQKAILTEVGKLNSSLAANQVVDCYRRIDRGAKSMTPAERDHYFDIIKQQLNSD